jgi:hypothetical protein
MFLFSSLAILVLSSSWSNSQPQDSATYQLYKICSIYDQGQSLQRSLRKLLPYDSCHPLSVNKKENQICFVAILSQSFTIEVIRSLPFTVIREISLEERVHESITHFLSLLSYPSISSSHGNDILYFTSRKSLTSKRKQRDLFQAKFLVTFGVGATNKFGTEIDKIQLQEENIRQRFLIRNPLEDLTRARPSSSRSTTPPSIFSAPDLWDQAIASLHRSSPSHPSASSSSLLDSHLCSDSHLHLELLPTFQIQFTNFRDYFTSLPAELHRACLLSLISHLLLTYPLLSDLRIIFPKYPSNHWNKGIVQNNTYSEDYPYHALAGLDGSGQIIGIGWSSSLSCILYPSLFPLFFIHHPR